MKALLKILGAILIPLTIGIIVAVILMLLGMEEENAKMYGTLYLGMSYTMYLYEIRFIKPGF